MVEWYNNNTKGVRYMKKSSIFIIIVSVLLVVSFVVMGILDQCTNLNINKGNVFLIIFSVLSLATVCIGFYFIMIEEDEEEV